MIAVAREKGEPTTPEELAAAYPTSPEIEWTTRLWLNAMEQADRSELNDDVNAAIVGYGEPGDVEMQNAMRRYHDDRVMSPAMFQASQAYLARRRDAVESAHEARRSGSLARFPLEHEMGDSASVQLMQRHRHLTNVLALELEVRRHEGERTGFGEPLLSLLALAESAQNHPGDMFQMLRCAEQNVAREHLQIALERRELSEDELLSLQQAWGAVDLEPALRLMLLEWQTEALHSLSAYPFEYLQNDRRPCPEEDAFYTATMFRRILDRPYGFDSIEAEAAIAAGEFERFLWFPFGAERFAGSKVFVDTVNVYPKPLRRYQTLNESIVVLLGCERFRRANGDWPENLADLAPAYLEQIPPDRYGGGTLKYRRTDDSVAVYSVGYDGTDDGGAITENYLEEPSDLGVRLRTGRIRSEEH